MKRAIQNRSIGEAGRSRKKKIKFYAVGWGQPTRRSGVSDKLKRGEIKKSSTSANERKAEKPWGGRPVPSGVTRGKEADRRGNSESGGRGRRNSEVQNHAPTGSKLEGGPSTGGAPNSSSQPSQWEDQPIRDG